MLPLRTLALAMLLAGTTLAHAQAPVIIPTNLTGPADKAAAVVNGEVISMGEVQKILEARPSPVPLTQEQQREMRKSALELLISDTLMRQYLTKQVPQVSATELNKEYEELKVALAKQKKTVEGMLKDTGTTMDLLQKDLTTRLQWRHYLLKVMPEDKAKEYYEQNKPFFNKEFVKASHILIKVDPKATPEQKAQMKGKIEAIRNEIAQKKVDFATAAKNWSDCPSKDKGGDIGPFPFKFVVVEPFSRTAFAMKVGEMSGVLETEFGYHVIWVTDRNPGEKSTYDSVRETLREVWAQDIDLHGRILMDMHKGSKIQVNLQ